MTNTTNSLGYLWLKPSDIENDKKPALQYLQQCSREIKFQIHTSLDSMLTEPDIENVDTDMFNENMNKLTCNAFGDYREHLYSIKFYDEKIEDEPKIVNRHSVVKFKNDLFTFILDDCVESLQPRASSTLTVNLSWLRVGVLVSKNVVMTILES